MRNRWMPSVCLGLTFFGAAALFESATEPVGITNGYLVSATGSEQQQALYQAAGEFRIVTANLLWARVIDQYHHQFMEQGGDWSKNESLLPILRTIIQLDPHFTQAYALMGGTILPRTGHVQEGKAILDRGIQNNPNEWELYREMAMLWGWTEGKPAQALPYAEAGLTHANDDFSRQLMTRLCHTLRDEMKQPVKTARAL